jgi:hypothetical protein
MWRPNHTNDYKFFDKLISEQFTVGGTGILLHKYIGTNTQANSYITSNSTTSGATLYFSNVANFEPGQTVQGVGIGANTVIVSTNTVSNTVVLSSNITSNISSGQSLSIFWKDATKPVYQNQSALNIQDLLFLENRDRILPSILSGAFILLMTMILI